MKFKKKEKSRIFDKGLWMTIFIVAVMVLSTIGFIYSDSASAKMTYNGYKFKQVDNKWVAKVNDEYKYFYYYPKELEFLNVSLRPLLERNNVVYITFDTNLSDYTYIDLARFELAEKMIQTKIIYNGVASLSEYYALPEITCANATDNTLVIYFKKSPEIKIVSEDNCIIASGKEMDYLMLKDRILYSYYGIMP